ncbi:hypothetical protein E4U42_002808 [Claviceps africana]|uniref:histidine kinase n=1 Tax=Claviceps africana TaxID=83212 RepID=A0A8K0J8B6_9HYPO|nr:hypothetical protein E4U42_002808 [Claviceps africana]
MVAPVDVSEAVRERETFRYGSPFIQRSVLYSPNGPPFEPRLGPSPDSALTAFSQLAVLRLKTSRALISLFDTTNQYVLAEATPDLGLETECSAGNSAGNDSLWLSNTAIPRTYGVCGHVLTACLRSIGDAETVKGDEALPVSIINDLAADARFAQRVLVRAQRCRFYAAVPIRTNRGVNIGVFCVIDEEPRAGLAADEMRFMRELSKVIMGHLEARRATKSQERTERMVCGISSFIDGSTDLTKNKFDPLPLSRNHHEDDDTGELPLPLREEGEGEEPKPQIRDPTMSIESTENSAGKDDLATRLRKIYTKAAQALCSSLDVEGLLFLDANVTTFGGASALDFRGASVTNSSSSSSSSSRLSAASSSSGDEDGSSGWSDSSAPVLGFSGSLKSPKLPQRFLRKLLQRYPKGTIFNFNQNGTVQSSECSGEETSADQDASAVPRKSGKRLRMKRSEQETLMNLLPGARCVAFAPVWDPSTQRWSAGTFAYTKASSRVFSTRSELSHLIAFGTIVMSEVSRLKAKLAQRSRMDVLSSLSHELRSPLHGVVLSVDMLHDSALDRFQKDVVHTIESCGRTLLDTVDHLLYWAKINNFNTRGLSRHEGASEDGDDKRDPPAGRRGRRRLRSAEGGMKSITTNVALDEVAEEVIESVFAGHTYQKIIAAHAAEAPASDEPSRTALRRLDCIHVAMDHVPMDSPASDVVVSLDVEPNAGWVFHTQAGALRRVIMNLLGNSLKYTTRGFIQVRLAQQSTVLSCLGRGDVRRGMRNVCLTISDSGRGISEEYLKSDLFVPFSQEDRLNPGVGLGLSLVKKIVSGLGGRIKVQSSLGRGTIISVELPLEAVPSTPAMSTMDDGERKPGEAAEDSFKRHVEMLSGLYVHVVGFPTHEESFPEDGQLGIPGTGKHFDQGAALVSICRDWLHMTVLHASAVGNTATTKVDVVICTAAHLDSMQRECRETTILTPVIVICSNVTVAKTVQSRQGDYPLGAFLECSSQPVGPRKLAKMLASILGRWNEQVSRSTSAEPTTPDTSGQEQPFVDALLASNQSPSEESPKHDYFKADAPPLPLSSPSSNAKCHEAVGPEKPKGSSSPPPRLSLSRDRFLLVDDNPINLKILSCWMKRMGHLHDSVRHGREAVETFRLGAGAYKCVFMDLSMPVMSGFEASCLIRQQEREAKLAACTIVALTGLASTEAQQEAFACGIDLFLTKPVRLQELRQLLTSQGLA